MGKNMISPAELKAITALDLRIPETVPEVPFPAAELEAKQDDYLLILGISIIFHMMQATVIDIVTGR